MYIAWEGMLQCLTKKMLSCWHINVSRSYDYWEEFHNNEEIFIWDFVPGNSNHRIYTSQLRPQQYTSYVHAVVLYKDGPRF